MKTLSLLFQKGATFYKKKLDGFLFLPTIKKQVNNYASIGLNYTSRSLEFQWFGFGIGVIK
jgi:hypothetical protein